VGDPAARQAAGHGRRGYRRSTVHDCSSRFIPSRAGDAATTSSYTVEVEDLGGSRRTRDELKLDMTVEIEAGAINDSGATATARRIRFESELAGLVSAVDVAGEAFAVLGQRVMVDVATVFDERRARGLVNLAVVQPVEVYAEFDAALQRYRATRAEPATLGTCPPASPPAPRRACA
jgi:hypothetical protein